MYTHHLLQLPLATTTAPAFTALLAATVVAVGEMEDMEETAVMEATVAMEAKEAMAAMAALALALVQVPAPAPALALVQGKQHLPLVVADLNQARSLPAQQSSTPQAACYLRWPSPRLTSTERNETIC